MSSPFKLIAVLIAAGFCVPAAFAADAVTSASIVPAAQKTQEGAVLEGTRRSAPRQDLLHNYECRLARHGTRHERRFAQQKSSGMGNLDVCNASR